MSKIALAASVLALTLVAPREEESALLYPAEPSETRLHFYALDGEPDMAKLRNALDDKDGAEVVIGPESDRARPGMFFVGIEAPTEVEHKDLEKAIKKGKSKPERLQWMLTSFTVPDLSGLGGGRSGGATNPEGMARRVILGSHGDMRWFEIAGDHAIFFWTGKKLDGEEIVDRTRKALKPYLDESELPKVVRDEFTWSLAAGYKASALRKVEREISKLGGVAEVETDEELGTVTVRVDLFDQFASAEAVPWPSDAAEDAEEAAGRGGAEEGEEGDEDDDPAPGGRDGGGRGGRADAGGGVDWFTKNRLVFDRNAAIAVLEKAKVHLADPLEDGAEGADPAADAGR